MPDSVRRAIRTFIQAFLGSLVGSGILSAVAANGVVDWSVARKVLTSAAVAGIIALVAWAQNALEDTGAVPKLLKAGPVPLRRIGRRKPQSGHVDAVAVLLGLILLVVLGILLNLTGHLG